MNSVIRFIIFSVLLFVNSLALAELPYNGREVDSTKWYTYDDTNKYWTMYIDKQSAKLTTDGNAVLFTEKWLRKDDDQYIVFENKLHLDKKYCENIKEYNSLNGGIYRYPSNEPNSILVYKYNVLAGKQSDLNKYSYLSTLFDYQISNRIFQCLIPVYEQEKENNDEKFENDYWIMINPFWGIKGNSIERDAQGKYLFNTKQQVKTNRYVVESYSYDPKTMVLSRLKIYTVENNRVIKFSDLQVLDCVDNIDLKTCKEEDRELVQIIVNFVMMHRGI